MPHPKPYRDGVAALTPQLLADSDSSRSRLPEVDGTAANPCSETARNRDIPALQNLVRKTTSGQMVERILWKCWQTGQPYDEAKWMESLKKRGSQPCEATQNVIKTNPKFMEAAGG
jgi:hypothetical protein